MKVSVIVPVYNSAEYLAECLESIKRQSLQDFEVLCIDDASRDGSLSICGQFASDDERFRIVALEQNVGAAQARNIGIERAAGEYIAFMDADDWYPDATCLEKLYRQAIEQDADLCAGSIDRFDVAADAVIPISEGEEHLSCFLFDDAGWVEYRDWQFDYGFTRFLYRRSFLVDEGITFPNLRRHEDPVFLVRCLVAVGRFYAIPDVVYRIRMGYKQMRFSERQIDDALEGIAQVLALSYEHDLPELRRWQKALLRQYFVESTGILEEFYLKDLVVESIRRVGKKASSAVVRRKGGR